MDSHEEDEGEGSFDLLGSGEDRPASKRPFVEIEDNDNRSAKRPKQNENPTVRKEQPRDEKRSMRGAQMHDHNNNISHKRQKPNSNDNWHRQENGGFGDFEEDGDDHFVSMMYDGHESTEISSNIPDYGFINDLCDSDFDDEDLKPDF